MEPPEPPELEPLGEWGKLIADYRSTGMSVEKHPMKLLRPGLDPGLLRSSDLEPRSTTARPSRSPAWSPPASAPRPPTASPSCCSRTSAARSTSIVPPPVYDRHRTLVRTAPLLRARGRLERREGTINVLVTDLAPLERAQPPESRPRKARERAVAELRAVAPAGHAFGRRGR